MYTQEEIDRIIERAVAEMGTIREPRNLYEPIEYMMSIGGKRLRPRLCLTACSLFMDEFDRSVIYPAISLEVFHEFTLIHDDIMDNSDTRRNQPTVYKKWGENCAILSGDVMSILAYHFLAYCRPEFIAGALELFNDTAVKVCEGQQYDMDFEDSPFITMEDYIAMIGLKTGVLIAASAKMGALLAGAPSIICDALYEYGYQLGLAFQITDDYLDTFGNQKIFGKKIGGDIMNNKKTWLLVKSMRLASGQDKEYLSELLSLGEDDSEKKIKSMQELYTRLGVRELAAESILEYHGKAMEAVADVGLSKEQLQCLADFAETLIHRKK